MDRLGAGLPAGAELTRHRTHLFRCFSTPWRTDRRPPQHQPEFAYCCYRKVGRLAVGEVAVYSPGAVLAGRYRLEERLGSGGMGEVWRATHVALGRTFAVKVMQPALVADPDAVRRFRTEAWAMGRIDHPGVVAVYDFHDDDSGAVLVMDFVEGQALAGRLRHGPLGPVETMQLVAQAARALQAAHDQGMVHRDVKPGNLLIRPDGTVVLTDFGVARLKDSAQLTGTGTVLGTPSYLAPEQALGEPATPLSDVYALGVVAYECLTGRRPFAGDSPFATAVARVTPPPPLPDHVPPAVREVVERAMARDPDDRWPSAGQLAAVCAHAAAQPAAPLAPLPAESTPELAPPVRLLSSPGRRSNRTAIAVVIATAAAATAMAITAAVTLVPQLTSWLTDDPALLNGHTGAVVSVAAAELDGTPIAVSASHDQTLRVWDLTTGRQIGEPLTGHTGYIRSVAMAELDGTPIAISAGGDDETVRVWDLTTGQQIGEPLRGHRTAIQSLAVGDLDGIPIVVSGGLGELRVWDLTAREQIGEPITTGGGWVWSVAVSELDGVPIAVSGEACRGPCEGAGTDATMRIFDLTTGQQIGLPLTGHGGDVASVAVAELDGIPIAVSAGGEDETVRVWDLTNGQQLGEPLTGHTGRVQSVAVGELDGTPLAVSGSHDRTIRVWDLATGAQIVGPLTSSGDVNCVALTEVDGIPTAIAGHRDRTLRVLPLTTG